MAQQRSRTVLIAPNASPAVLAFLLDKRAADDPNTVNVADLDEPVERQPYTAAEEAMPYLSDLFIMPQHEALEHPKRQARASGVAQAKRAKRKRRRRRAKRPKR